MDQTGVLQQGQKRRITPTARITLFASTKHLSIEESVLKESTLTRKKISAMTHARLVVYNLATFLAVTASVTLHVKKSQTRMIVNDTVTTAQTRGATAKVS